MENMIAVVGVPSALGGQLANDGHHGMAHAPAERRRRGFLERLAEAGLPIRDDGGVAIDPPYRNDPAETACSRSSAYPTGRWSRGCGRCN